MPKSLFLLLVLVQSTFGAADTVTLRGESALTGQVTTIRNGLIHLQSPLADDPLLIKSEQFAKLIFGNDPGANPSKHSGKLQLRNGDWISGDLRELDDQSISLDTWYAGCLTVPRQDITSLYLGVKPQELLYQGPKGLAGWEEINRWDFEEDHLFSTGLGSITRKVNFPEQYILTITLAWKKSPNCVIHIGAEHADPRHQKSDEYLLTYNTSGLDLKRHSPGEKRNYLSLENLQAPPAQVQSGEAVIELRVNRKTREILLYLNGKKIGRYLDPLETVPHGPYLTFDSRSSQRAGNIIKDIQLRKWDAVTEHLQREDPPDDKSVDALTTSDGERYSGKITVYDPEKGSIGLDNPHAEKTLAIPVSKVAVLHFRKNQQARGETAPSAYRLDFTSGGHLSLDTLDLQKDTLVASHPILGNIKLDRRILRQLSQKSAHENPAARHE